mgnify:FL=1
MDKYADIKKNIMEYANRDADIKAIVVIGSFEREEVTVDEDGYLKKHLLKMMELYCFLQDGRDVWHEGRFLDQWAENSILKELKKCFAYYKKDDIMRALRATHDLFDRIARGGAEMLGYDYPAGAKECSDKFINRCSQL